jgi:predicted negative regulator of RcsB-dependent stress response
MRKLLVAVILVILLVVVGWMSFQYDGNKASVNFDAAEMREDTKEALQKGEAVLENAARHGKEFVEDSADDVER